MKHIDVNISILTMIENELETQGIKVNNIETIILKHNSMRIYDRYDNHVDYEIKLIKNETCSTTT